MRPLCPASAKLTLPNLLQTICYSECALQLRIRPAHPLLSRSSPSSHGFTNQKRFNSSFGAESSHTKLSAFSQYDHLPSADSLSATLADKSPNDNQARSENATITASLSSQTSEPNKNRAKSQTRPGRRDSRSRSDGAPRANKTESNDRKPFDPTPKKKRETWQVQKDALKKKFEAGWAPPKKLSPDALEGIRHLHAVAPDRFTTPVLAEQFKVSPEAIRRILKSKWRPSEVELEGRRKRWEKRHDRIWSHFSELGLRPHTKRAEDFSDAKALLYNNKGLQGESKE